MISTDQTKSLYPLVTTPIILLFCGYVVTWYLQLGSRITFLGTIRFEFIYAILLLLIAVFVLPKVNLKCRLVQSVILYYLVLILQLFISRHFELSYTVFVDRVFKFSVFSLLITSFVRSPRDLRYFLASFLLSCLKMGQEGLVGKVSGNMAWQDQGIMRLHGSTSLYSHPNSFSGMALGTIPFIYKIWNFVNFKSKAVLFLLFLLSLNIIVYTGSRTGYIGLLGITIIIFIKCKPRGRILISSILGLALLTGSIEKDYYERFLSIFTQTDKQGGSTIARKQIIVDAIEIFAENPMGVGIAAFPKVRFEKFGRSQDTHNLYLEIATNLGIHGFIVFMVLIYNMKKTLDSVKYTADSIIRDTNINDKAYIALKNDMEFIIAIAEAVWLFILVRLLLGFFGMDLYEIYWWFAIGLSIALHNMVNACKENLNKGEYAHGDGNIYQN